MSDKITVKGGEEKEGNMVKSRERKGEKRI